MRKRKFIAKPKNQFTASVLQICQNEGCTFEELLEDYATASQVPACCTKGCFTEPDGFCEHNNPSILVEMVMI